MVRGRQSSKTRTSHNVEWVRKYLGVYAPEGLLVHPVIVVPGDVPPTAGNTT